METKSTGQIIKEMLEQKGISQKELAAWSYRSCNVSLHQR